MNKKTLSTYLVGAITGLGLTMGSVAFAQNMGNSNNHAMGPSNQTGMHGQTVNMGNNGNKPMGQTNQAGMNGQVMQNGMHKQTAKMGFRGNMHGGSTHHAFFDNQASVHDENS